MNVCKAVSIDFNRVRPIADKLIGFTANCFGELLQKVRESQGENFEVFEK
jgi:hypothetical protein